MTKRLSTEAKAARAAKRADARFDAEEARLENLRQELKARRIATPVPETGSLNGADIICLFGDCDETKGVIEIEFKTRAQAQALMAFLTN